MKNLKRIFWTGFILALAAAAFYFLSFDDELRTKPSSSPTPAPSRAPLPEGNIPAAPRKNGDAFLPEVGDRAGDFTVAEVASSPHGFSVGYAGRTTVTGRVTFDAAAEAYCFEVAAADTEKIPWSGDEGSGPAKFCFDDTETLPADMRALSSASATATIEITDYTKEYYGIEVTDTARFVRVVNQ